MAWGVYFLYGFGLIPFGLLSVFGWDVFFGWKSCYWFWSIVLVWSVVGVSTLSLVHWNDVWCGIGSLCDLAQERDNDNLGLVIRCSLDCVVSAVAELFVLEFWLCVVIVFSMTGIYSVLSGVPLGQSGKFTFCYFLELSALYQLR